MRKPITIAMLCLFSAIFSVMTSGCNGSTGDVMSSGIVQDTADHTPANIPPGAADPDNGTPDTPADTGVVGASCSSSDTHHMCLGLKYAVYQDSAGTPVVSQQEAIENLKTINQDWAPCDVAFQIDEFAPIAPESYGLTYQTANSGELDTIRAKLENDTTLLVVTTGPWNRSGTLGNTGANAWTNMPGGSVFGAILESPVGTYANIIAHELGHYLNLDHMSDNSNLMSPIIYATSSSLTTTQCADARSAVNYFWPRMKR